MPDYSFMKSGFSTLNEPGSALSTVEKDQIVNLLMLFTSNGLRNAGRYVEMSGRNAMTTEDMRMGLIYEVFEFTKRSDNEEKLREIEAEAAAEEASDEASDEASGDEWTDIESDDDVIVPDELSQPFTRVSVSDVPEADKEFITKMHDYSDGWVSWEPETPIQVILKNAINKMM